MPNPFYVDPAVGYDPSALQGFNQALMGLGQVNREKREKEAAIAQQAEMQAGMEAAIQSGDPSQIAAFMRANPDQADIIKQSIAQEGEMVQQDATNFLSDILTTPEDQWMPKLKQRVEAVEARGGDPKHSVKLIESFGNNPQQAKKDAEVLLATVGTPGAYDAYKVATEVDKGIDPVKQLEIDLKKEKSVFDKASKLRGEIAKATGAFGDVEDSYGRVQASQEGDVNAASDIALIFNFMKMLDPGSVVREGEFATAQNAAGVPDRVVNVYNRLIDGERLNPKQRKNFVGEAKKQFDTAKRLNDRRLKEFTKLGERFGLEREDIILRDNSTTQSESGEIMPVTTQAEYDSLPSGAVYLEDGVQYRKP